ncbi:MAG TPA: carbohydrate ABC transporter permease [Spirochaetia bacterium]|nr:carbohydrate ABC transporter permease [Spirochaetia bacterium]
MRRAREDVIFDTLNYLMVTVFLLLILYPLYFILIASISNPDYVNRGAITFLPRGITFEGYARTFRESNVWRGYRNTLLYTTVGTSINVFLTMTAGYALSRKELAGRSVIMRLIVFTMLFSGGLIPTYLIVKGLGMTNTLWAMVIPNAVSAWNLIIARTYLQQSIPQELLEASLVDGCSYTRFFTAVVVPLSGAIIAVLALLYSVAHWNSFFTGLIYLQDYAKYPLQLILRDILLSYSASGAADDAKTLQEMQRVADLMKYALILVASLPVMVLYPFLQRYFVKGVLVGAIKG